MLAGGTPRAVTTGMAPLIVLISAFAFTRLFCSRVSATRAARIALAVMLLLTAGSHFTSTAELSAMLPLEPMLADPLVYLTGLAELGFAIALLRRERPTWLGAAIVVFFAVLLPANVYSAFAGTGMGGHGPAYLWFRVPLQGLFIGWAWWSTRREGTCEPTIRECDWIAS